MSWITLSDLGQDAGADLFPPLNSPISSSTAPVSTASPSIQSPLALAARVGGGSSTYAMYQAYLNATKAAEAAQAPPETALQKFLRIKAQVASMVPPKPTPKEEKAVSSSAGPGLLGIVAVGGLAYYALRGLKRRR